MDEEQKQALAERRQVVMDKALELYNDGEMGAAATYVQEAAKDSSLLGAGILQANSGIYLRLAMTNNAGAFKKELQKILGMPEE
jgi:hypothetical protein